MAKKAGTPTTVTLKHLAAAIAEDQELSKKQSEAILTDLVDRITKHLKKGDRIRMVGLGILQVRKRAARMGRNPATGEAIHIKASKKVAFRAAKELKDGFYVNLGIGIPTLVSNYIPKGMSVQLQSENGMLGMGPFPYEGEEDPDLINAGKQTVTELASTSYFSSADSFGMVRGGHIDLSILGAMQVAQNGDLANWMIPGKMVKGMGGAMDLVAGVKRVVVVMEHSAKDGPKLLKKCNLPLTGAAVVDMVITDLGVFQIDRNGSGMILLELAPEVSLQEIQGRTEASFALGKGIG